MAMSIPRKKNALRFCTPALADQEPQREIEIVIDEMEQAELAGVVRLGDVFREAAAHGLIAQNPVRFDEAMYQRADDAGDGGRRHGDEERECDSARKPQRNHRRDAQEHEPLHVAAHGMDVDARELQPQPELLAQTL